MHSNTMLLSELLYFRKILFLQGMTYYEKNTYNNEGNSNHKDYAEAQPNRVVPVIIQHKDKRT